MLLARYTGKLSGVVWVLLIGGIIVRNQICSPAHTEQPFICEIWLKYLLGISLFFSVMIGLVALRSVLFKQHTLHEQAFPIV